MILRRSRHTLTCSNNSCDNNKRWLFDPIEKYSQASLEKRIRSTKVSLYLFKATFSKVLCEASTYKGFETIKQSGI